MSKNAGLLSQNEIDALLAAVSTESSESVENPGPHPEPVSDKARPYDFRRPDRFSKDQMRALRMIHESMARRVSISLSAFLRSSVEVSLSDIDQGTYMSFNNQLGVQGIYYVIALGTLPGHFILFLSSDLTSSILDKLMGGQGMGVHIDRDPTDLELGLLRVIIDKIMFDLTESWSGTATIRPKVEDTSFNLMLVPIALPSDAMVWCSFEFRLKGVANGAVLGLPYPVLKPIAAQLRPYTWTTNTGSSLSEGTEVRREDLRRGLKEVRLPVSAILGSAPLSIEDLANLEKGDIIPLGTPADGRCQLDVNGVPKFQGRPGLRGRRLCVRIEKVIDTANGWGDLSVEESGSESRDFDEKSTVTQGKSSLS